MRGIVLKSIKILVLFLYFTTFSEASQSFFKPNYSFATSSINYLDWSKNSKSKTIFKDFTYLEVEYGAGWSWGEFYGFLDLENPSSSYYENFPDGLRVVAKPILDINIYKNIAFHIQDFYLDTKDYYLHNIVAGVSYKYSLDYDFWIRPFIGVHYLKDSFYSDFNGYMAGWTFLYNFKLLDQDFSIFQWHEMEFLRKLEKNFGVNGALSTWWNINKDFSLGAQYRYTLNKLGYNEYLSAGIYTFKYRF